jgi:hypothetical protein
MGRSIRAMVPSVEPSDGASMTAARDEETRERSEQPRPRGRELSPMVIRGGLVGHAFPGQIPDPASSPAPTAAEPSARTGADGVGRASPDSGDPSVERRRPAQSTPEPQSPTPRYDQPAAPPTGIPM